VTNSPEGPQNPRAGAADEVAMGEKRRGKRQRHLGGPGDGASDKRLQPWAAQSKKSGGNRER
jgi:hypothetical protein